MPTTLYFEPSLESEQDEISDTREIYEDRFEPVRLAIELSDAEAWEAFNNTIEPEMLPPLPLGFRWVTSDDKFGIIRDKSVKEKDYLLILYGPDKKGNVNFAFQMDGATLYTFAHTKKGPTVTRKYPFSQDDFRVPGFDYRVTKYKRHVMGHGVDHCDTIVHKNVATSSTYDGRNFVPEPPNYEFGMGIRRLAAKEARDQQGIYAQWNHYSADSWKTQNGTLVPDEVHFFTFGQNNTKTVYNLSFSENLKRPAGSGVLEHAKTNFTTSYESCPVVVPYNCDEDDRTLRRKTREIMAREQLLNEEKIESRFPDKDKLFAAAQSGDAEINSAGHKLHAGILYAEKGKNSSALKLFDRSSEHGDKLLEAKEKDKLVIVYSKDQVKEAKKFFSKTTNAKIEEVGDHLCKIFKDMKL